MRDNGKTYVDYISKIEKMSKYIFENNPFDCIFEDSLNASAFKEMQSIRNYIAHDSNIAEMKYIDKCFSGDKRHFKEPNEYLMSKEKSTKTTYYSYYIELICNMMEFLIDYPE